MLSSPPLLSGLLSGLYSVYAAAIFCLNTLVVFCPLIIVAPGVALRRRIASLGMHVGTFCMGVPLRVIGREHLPPGPCIAVCNHASYLDGLILTGALPPRFTFVIQHGAAKWPYAGLVLRRMGYRFVNRTSAREGAVQTRQLIRDLHRGESLAVFAEGTFAAEPGLLPFKNGAFMMAAKAQLPVVPMAIRGSRRLLGGGHWRFRWSPITVEIGPPIAPLASAAALRDAVRAQVLKLCGEPDRHAPPTDTAEPPLHDLETPA